MPLKIGSQDIPRIYAGNEKIKRAYQGNELVYGLYDVHYYDRDNIDNYDNIGNVYDNKLQKEYAWGYTPECNDIVLPNASYRNEYNLNGYPTHFGNSSALNGWYKDNLLTQQKAKIELNDKEDLNMYARWRQHKYAYEGIIEYEIWDLVDEPDPPGPGPQPPTPQGFWRRTSAPSIGDVAYTVKGYTTSQGQGVSSCILGSPAAWYGSSLNNCVGYVWGRWYEMGASPDKYGLANSGAYVADHNEMSWTPNLGAVACWGTSDQPQMKRHVAIVECLDPLTWTQSVYSGQGTPNWQEVVGADPYSYWGLTFRGYLLFPGSD